MSNDELFLAVRRGFGGGFLGAEEGVWRRNILCCSVTADSDPQTPRGMLRTQKLKTRLLRTQSLKVLPLKPGIGQYMAKHASPTAWDFFLDNF